MARTFEYAVLTATPDKRRAERVNVGVAVFRDDTVDIRFESASYKLRALTGHGLTDRLEAASARFQSLYDPTHTPAENLKTFARVEPLLLPSDLGWLVADDNDQYEARVSAIIESLVKIPKRRRVASGSRINTEIQAAFRNAKILAAKDEDIDTKKVVKNFPIANGHGLTADFALKNGKLHIASTLDLRTAAGREQTALKSIILDQAKEHHRKTLTIGVYAVDAHMRADLNDDLGLFASYADVLIDWQSRDEKRKLGHLLEDAIGIPPGGLFS